MALLPEQREGLLAHTQWAFGARHRVELPCVHAANRRRPFIDCVMMSERVFQRYGSSAHRS